MSITNLSKITVVTSVEEGRYQPGYEAIAEKIVELIATSSLKAGDRLPTEQHLAQQLGVSRTMVREAVKILTASGHVRTRRGSGIYVTDRRLSSSGAIMNLFMPVDPQHILALFEFRCMQEILTTQLATERITMAELRTLERAVVLNRQGAETGNWELFIDNDNAFHQGIAEATHNPFLVDTIATVLRLQRRAVKIMTGGAPGSQLNSARQHETIFNAMKEGNASAAAEAMKLHVETVIADYQQEVRRRLLLDEHPES
jgi:GntR family transcriptional regulator, transcriptional repressor for pyruvate dehydrogenase complex